MTEIEVRLNRVEQAFQTFTNGVTCVLRDALEDLHGLTPNAAPQEAVEHVDDLQHISTLMGERVAKPMTGSSRVEMGSEIINDEAQIAIIVSFPVANIATIAKQYDDDWCASRKADAAPREEPSS